MEQNTCQAVNCTCPHYHGVMACDRPAVQIYTLRPGVELRVCAAAARQLPAKNLKPLR